MVEKSPNSGKSPEDLFRNALAEDSTLFGLVTHEKLIAKRIALLEEQPQHGLVPQVLYARADRLRRAVEQREAALRDMWAEAKADPDTFKLVVPMRDWQGIAERESDPVLKQEALIRFQDAREAYEFHVYGDEGAPPDSGV